MAKRKKQKALFGTIPRVFLGLVLFVLLYMLLINGNDVALFNPKGLIATEEHKLTLFAAAVLLGIAIPTLAVLYFFAWKYREDDRDAPVPQAGMTASRGRTESAEPTDRRGPLFLFVLWGVPLTLFVILSFIMWSATHRLEPQKAIAATTPTQTIEVVALRWKWLFIYPEQHIATVNFVQIPTDTPVRFELTADDAPMSSFWIPHLSGMLYAMTGHVNPLNLMADTPGDYPGSTAEINGEGFAGMKFTARVSTPDEFSKWVEKVQLSDQELSASEYQKLLKPSESNPAAYYSYADENLYDTILAKYTSSHNHQEAEE